MVAIELHLCTPGRHAATGSRKSGGHLSAQELDESHDACLAAHKLVGCTNQEAY